MALPKYGEEPSGGGRDNAASWGILLGSGLAGIASSIGIIPLLVIVLGVLGVGIALAVIFLPLLLAGATAAFAYFVARAAGLKGWKMFVAPFVAGVGSLLLFSYADVTLLSMSSPLAEGAMKATGYSAQGGASAQLFGIGEGLSNAAKLLQLAVGGLIILMVVVSIVSLNAMGGDIGGVFGGALGMLFTGMIAAEYLDIGIPGLAAKMSGETGTSAMIAPWVLLVSALSVGIAATSLITWRES